MVLLTAFPLRKLPQALLLLLLLPLQHPPHPMPGNILDVKVAAGASVKAGDVLVILEAMKMENEIVAPQDGTVASINVNKGDTVNSGDVLVSMN